MVILFVLNACQNAAGGDTKNNTEKEKNFAITIKCPNELVGKKLQVHHLPDKIESRTYSGGWAKISDSGIAVYSQNLHFANWDLSLIYLQKKIRFRREIYFVFILHKALAECQTEQNL